MPLDLSMIYSAVTVCGDKTDDAGQTQRVRNGTGFILTIPSETISGRKHGYVITPHHVINGLANIEIELANPYKVGELYPPIPVRDWRRSEVHPDADLAFAPLVIPQGQSAVAVELGAQVIYDLDVKLGADFHYIGLLAPLGVPMARTGTIGALDVPGIKHDGPYVYDAHLGDVRSYGGFSGSPCYIEYPLASLEPVNPAQFPMALPGSAENKPYGALAFMHVFCGMFTEHFSDKRMSGFASIVGLGVILPANTIIEALMTDKQEQERRNDDERYANSLQTDIAAEAVSASVSDSDDEFQRFEDLTRQLVQTPKPQTD